MTTTTTTATSTDVKNVTLIRSDEKKISIPIDAAKLSMLLVLSLNLDEEDNNNNNDDNTKNRSGDDQDNNDNDNEEQSLLVADISKVDYDTLAIIAKFLMYASDYPLNINTEFIKAKFEDNIDDPFYVDYMNTLGEDMDVLYKVKDAANYMSIQSLLELICMYIVGELEKCQSTEECMKLLRIPAFASEQEEEELRKNAGWMFRFPPQQIIREAAREAAAAIETTTIAAETITSATSTTSTALETKNDDICCCCLPFHRIVFRVTLWIRGFQSPSPTPAGAKPIKTSLLISFDHVIGTKISPVGSTTTSSRK